MVIRFVCRALKKLLSGARRNRVSASPGPVGVNLLNGDSPLLFGLAALPFFCVGILVGTNPASTVIQ